MTVTDRAAVERLLELARKATPGPWTTEKPGKTADGWAKGIMVAATGRGQGIYADPPGGSYPENDREFIAACRELVPALCERFLAPSGVSEGITDAMVEAGARALGAFGAFDQGKRCMHGNEPASECEVCNALIEVAKDDARACLTAALSAPNPPAERGMETTASADDLRLATALRNLAFAYSAEIGKAAVLNLSFAADRLSRSPGWLPTHRHVKRGSVYREIGRGFAQVAVHPIEEMTAVTIYQGRDGTFWVRNAVEFDDGRFEEIPTPPNPGEGA